MIEMDLNLLRVFDTLMDERSVTRAASRLGLTQSAISHSLSRLRQVLGDPLFVRGSGGLQPTARAIEIAPGIREGLDQLRGALAPSLFDPATASRTFTVSAGSYFCALLIPHLVAHARETAPDIHFQVVAPDAGLLASLDEGSADLALGSFGDVPGRLNCEELFEEQLVWIGRAGADKRKVAGQVEIASRIPLRRRAAFVSEGGIERRVLGAGIGSSGEGEAKVAVYDSLTAAAVVGASDLVALVPLRIAEANKTQLGVEILDRPAPPDLIPMQMLWHSKAGDDAGLSWLRTLIRNALDRTA